MMLSMIILQASTGIAPSKVYSVVKLKNKIFNVEDDLEDEEELKYELLNMVNQIRNFP